MHLVIYRIIEISLCFCFIEELKTKIGVKIGFINVNQRLIKYKALSSPKNEISYNICHYTDSICFSADIEITLLYQLDNVTA